MRTRTRTAHLMPAGIEGLVCLLTAPVLSPSRQGSAAPPVVEVYASQRPRPTWDDAEAQRDATRAFIARAEADFVGAVAAAAAASRTAADKALLAQQGALAAAEAAMAAGAAEVARTWVAELAIASALAQAEILGARIAALELRRERAEMRASVASLLMVHDAEVGTGLPGSPMFTLTGAGATPERMPQRVDVFEEDLMRLVSGQTVALAAIGPTGDRAQAEGAVVDLRARLGNAGVAFDDPSRLVRGVFLTVAVTGAATKALTVTGPTSNHGQHGCA